MKLTSTDSKFQPVYSRSHQLQHTSINDESFQITSEVISTVSSASSSIEPYQIMLNCNDKLVTAISLDPQCIAGILLTKGLIPENIEAQMRQCSTPHERATILVTAVRKRIEIAPKRFHEFLKILSQQPWTKDIAEILQSYISPNQSRKDASVQVANTGDHNKSSGEISSDGEDCAFHKLNSKDQAEFEAQLILSADNMRKNSHLS